MMFPCTLVGVVVSTFARSSPRNSFVDPLMVVVPVALAAPKPITLPVTLNAPASPNPKPAFMVIPAYRRAAAVNVRGAVWKIRLLEIVQLSLLPWISMPDTDVVALKKSKMLSLSIRLPVFGLPAVPRLITALLGRLVPAGARLQNETMLPLLPRPEVVLNRTFPPAVPIVEVDEPRTVHLVTTLFCAPLIKRMVLVLAVADAVMLERINALPAVPSPSIVTLVAPLRSISGLPAAIAPAIVGVAPPDGWTEIEV